MSDVAEYLPRAGEFDPLAGESPTSEPKRNWPGKSPFTAGGAKAPAADPVLRVLSLSEVCDYEPPVGSLLVGDGVLELGEVALLFGPPGSFKGFAVGDLMASGARGSGFWLGHPVQAQFASLWLNCENGRRRLRDQFRKMQMPPEAEAFIHVTDIPAVWNLTDTRLVGEIRRVLVEKQIRLLVVDTVSNFLADEFAKEFAAFFAALNTLTHGLEPKPAVLLIHHSRKPKETDRGARGLLNLISGHQTLQRRARSICYLGRVTDEFEEKRLAAVWLKVSNNGEAEGQKTALQLADDATLRTIEGFDWTEWVGSTGNGNRREAKVREEHLREIFQNGRQWLAVRPAAERLQALAGVGRSAAYEALKVNGGRFSALLVRDAETHCISFKGAEPDGEE